ncbi:MAG TPA: RidA family protein [Chitinophagales bacterium]|nr:RidA family protein [Chitinophagales bacterium]
MQKNIIETNQAPAAIGPYSQAVKTGNLIFVSGQIPLDPQTGNMVTEGIEVETHRVMKNLEAILMAANSNFDHVVKTTIFLKTMDDFAKVNAVYASYFTGNFPARETVEVSRLPKDARVEISVIANAAP